MTQQIRHPRRHMLRQLVGFAALAIALPRAHAHGDAHRPRAAPAKKEQKDWGIAGERKAAKRTLRVGMSDNMRFTPASMRFKTGETVRFVVMNHGAALHEFVIGTVQENIAHAQLMKKFPNMEHDEPYMAHVPPGQTASIVWTFNRPGEFEFACLVAGHYDAGMKGRIVVV